jgi:hypothetical protein
MLPDSAPPPAMVLVAQWSDPALLARRWLDLVASSMGPRGGWSGLGYAWTTADLRAWAAAGVSVLAG